jgi:hypothetical protein
MYISQFWCGVLATIGIEFIMLIVYAIYQNTKEKGEK